MGTIWSLRRRRGLTATIIGAVAVVGAAFAPGSVHAACTPLLPITTCPAPPPASPSVTAPVVTIGTVTNIDPRAATVNGTVNPGGGSTTYQWGYTLSRCCFGGQVTPDQVVPAGTTAVPISTRITGLIPGEAYDIDLEATNSAGQVTATQRVALTTPSHPVFTVRLSHDVIRLGQPFEVTVKEGGSYDSEQAVDAWIAKAPYRHWVDAGPATPTGRGRLFEYPCPPPNQYDGGCSWLDRNFRVRVQQGSHRSRARHVYVYPNTVLTTEREKYNTSPYLDLTYSAGVHRTSGAYPREQVYFYSSPARHGPYTRVASVRLRARREYKAELLIARARIYSPQAVYTIACIPHQLFRDMGRPFRVRWCGSRRLH